MFVLLVVYIVLNCTLHNVKVGGRFTPRAIAAGTFVKQSVSVVEYEPTTLLNMDISGVFENFFDAGTAENSPGARLDINSRRSLDLRPPGAWVGDTAASADKGRLPGGRRRIAPPLAGSTEPLQRE